MSWRGMDLYRQALRGWPQTVAEQAAPIVERHARAAFEDIHDGYPVVTGTLRDGLTLTETSPSPLHPRWTLENAVVYAKIFEAGGATTLGPKPAGRVFVPIARREVLAMRAEIVDLLERVTPYG